MTLALGGPPRVVGSAMQFRLYSTYRGQTAVNTFYYLVSAIFGGSASWSQTTLALAYATATGVGPLMRAAMTTGATYYGLQAKDLLTPAVGVAPEIWSNGGNSTVGTGVGSAGTTPLGTQDCGLAYSTTAQPGKTGRGRVYLPFLDESQIVAATGLTTAGYKTAANAVLTAIGYGTATTIAITDGISIMNIQCYLHRYGQPNYYAILAANVRNGVATQRRRGTTFGRLNSPPF